MISEETLQCIKGDTLIFEIDMEAGVDFTGAHGVWTLQESWFDGAKVFLTKDDIGDGSLFINQELGVWKVIVEVDPVDTETIPAGTLFHTCKVTLADGTVGHVASGPFVLGLK